MKKLIVICIVCALCLFVILYGVAAFCWWDINPVHWDSVTRFFVSLLSVGLTPCFSAFAVHLYKEFKEYEDLKNE